MTTSNLDFELKVLGLILKDPSHVNSREALDSLSENDFTSNDHAAIFKTKTWAIDYFDDNKRYLPKK